MATHLAGQSQVLECMELDAEMCCIFTSAAKLHKSCLDC